MSSLRGGVVVPDGDDEDEAPRSCRKRSTLVLQAVSSHAVGSTSRFIFPSLRGSERGRWVLLRALSLDPAQPPSRVHLDLRDLDISAMDARWASAKKLRGKKKKSSGTSTRPLKRIEFEFVFFFFFFAGFFTLVRDFYSLCTTFASFFPGLKLLVCARNRTQVVPTKRTTLVAQGRRPTSSSTA